MRFNGYRRPDGTSGARNCVVIIPAINCANDISYQLAMTVPGAIPLCHTYMCPYEKRDRDKAVRTLIGIGKNPNVYGVLVVGTGCEPVPAEEMTEGIKASGKPVMTLSINTSGYDGVMEKGREFLLKCLAEAAELKREPCELSDIIWGIKCGGSGSLSLLSNNAAVGRAADLLIAEGGSVIFSETPEILGMEHTLAKRAVNEEVAGKILKCVGELQKNISYYGVDLLGSEPNKGNMASGLTTIEEKSLGAIAKGGTTPLMDFLEFGQAPAGKGLFFMDCESAGDPVYVGEAAAGAQLSALSLAGGMPAYIRGLASCGGAGLQTLPVFKVLGSNDCKSEEQFFDVCVGSIIDGTESIDEAGERIFQKLISVVSGETTFTERYNKYWAPIAFYRNGLIV